MFTYQITLSLLMMAMLIIYTQQQQNDPAFMEKFDKMSEECEKEIGVDEELVEKAWKENHFPNDSKFKCFLKCLNVKLGVITQNGDVVDDVLGEVVGHFVDAATKSEVVQECGAIQGADLCETAMKLVACFKNATLD